MLRSVRPSCWYARGGEAHRALCVCVQVKMICSRVKNYTERSPAGGKVVRVRTHTPLVHACAFFSVAGRAFRTNYSGNFCECVCELVWQSVRCPENYAQNCVCVFSSVCTYDTHTHTRPIETKRINWI